jgi:hypothetical protein
MKLNKIRTSINEMWKFPTRALRCTNQETNYSNASCLFSDSNSINPKEYFKKRKTIAYPISK